MEIFVINCLFDFDNSMWFYRIGEAMINKSRSVHFISNLEIWIFFNDCCFHIDSQVETGSV